MLYLFLFLFSSLTAVKAKDQNENLTVLHFSGDWDRNEENGTHSHATLRLDDIPPSFTICVSFQVESWTSGLTSAFLFVIQNEDGLIWMWAKINAAIEYTEFTVSFGTSSFTTKTSELFSPMQWVRVCFSLKGTKANLVVDGKHLVATDVGDNGRPETPIIVLGGMAWSKENPGRISDFNMFSSDLTVERMVELTKAGGEDCGAGGDLLSWDQTEWTLHSKAKTVEVDRKLDGPCWRESKFKIFTIEDKHWQKDCMNLCQKLGGRSPHVRTLPEWEDFIQEVDAASPFMRSYPHPLWLSATEGGEEMELGRLPHWPKGTRSEEGVWRDYYTGYELDNYTRPWAFDFKDTKEGNKTNCLLYDPEWSLWKEWNCFAMKRGCPCIFPSPPVLQLRGSVCESSSIQGQRYTIRQSPQNPQEIIMVGFRSSQIFVWDTNWILRDAPYDVTAWSHARKESFSLGKHNWTVRDPGCSDDQNTYEMKLTGCKEGEFTCDDGQCIKMEERCNQLPNCRDKSDERRCEILLLEDGYNKRIPPISSENITENKITKARVEVAINLLKLVNIEEERHSIEFQFEITLKWKESRATYHNLKQKRSLNSLNEGDIQRLWLPLVVYANTDQKETTRLGMGWEWTTTVSVLREGNFTRSDLTVLDEIEIFKGEENSLVMEQAYTHEFQCVYDLVLYPFDTQVTVI